MPSESPERACPAPVPDEVTRALLDGVADAVLLADSAGTLKFVSQAIETCLGCTPDEAYALDSVEALLGGDPAPWADAAGNISRLAWPIADRAGRQRTLLLDARRVDTHPGHILYTCRKASSGQDDFRELVERSPDVIVRLDRQLRHVYANPSIEAATGIPAAAFIGQTHQELGMPPTLVALWQQAAEQVFQTARATSLEFDFDGPNGIRHYQALFYPELAGDGTVRFVAAVGRDITAAKQSQQALQQQAQRERVFANIARRISRSLSLEAILSATVEEVRRYFGCDRAVVYRFQPEGGGTFEAESVAPGWRSLLGQSYRDPCFERGQAERYRQGRICAIADVSATAMASCHRDMLAQFQLQANLVVPIVRDGGLWGLLAAQHCAGPYPWQQSEVELLQQLAVQAGIAIQNAELYRQLEVANGELQAQATTDRVTQIANRNSLDSVLETEWQRLTRSGGTISLVLCDVDRFKAYNDRFGHLEGDRCLHQVAQTLAQQVRGRSDLVARYGGEEFALLLPQTPRSGARHVAQRAQAAIRALQLPHVEPSSTVTLSFGVASMQPSAEVAATTLVDRADRALYWAKTTGRDRIVSELECQLD